MYSAAVRGIRNFSKEGGQEEVGGWDEVGGAGGGEFEGVEVRGAVSLPSRSWMPVHSYLAAMSAPLHAEDAHLARNDLICSDLINVSGMSTMQTSAPDLQ